ncbi:MAG: L,D-transpeptidase family protein [Kiritimatiellia bacterium]
MDYNWQFKDRWPCSQGRRLRGLGPRPKGRAVSEIPEAVVDVASQTMTVSFRGRVVRVYRVSTAKAGVGSAEGSGQTPPGRHRVARLFGHAAPPGQVFVSRRAVRGHIIPSAAWRTGGGADCVLTRILWLEGLEPGVNRGPGIDSHDRYIYIHGTNQEQLLGTPASHGCIRMANLDVIDLFNFVKRRRGLIVTIS